MPGDRGRLSELFSSLQGRRARYDPRPGRHRRLDGAALCACEGLGMNEPDFDADAVIAAMAPLLGLVVGEASQKPVNIHLEIAARYAALLEQAALDDHEEPAPVYES